MYNLTIHFGPNNLCWNFLYKTEEAAFSAFKGFAEPISGGNAAVLKDDFGQQTMIMLVDIHGVLLEDMDAGQEARIALSMIQQKTQLRATKRAMSDPEIMQMAREQQRQQQMPVIQPGGLNGGFRQ